MDAPNDFPYRVLVHWDGAGVIVRPSLKRTANFGPPENRHFAPGKGDSPPGKRGLFTNLGGGNSDISEIFTPKIGEDEPILTIIFFKGVGSTTK